MRLLGGLLSPFVMRCVLAARFKGENIAVEMPEGGLKTSDYLALNPMGKMPVLVDGDFALPESAVIVEYLDEVLDGPKLLPDVPEGRALARLLARVGDLYIVPNLTPIFQARQNPDAVPAAIEKLREALGYLETLRPPHARCLVGDEATVADATIMPLFFFLDAFDGPFGTGKLIAERPGLATWWEARKATELGTRMMAEMGAELAAFTAPRATS